MGRKVVRFFAVLALILQVKIFCGLAVFLSVDNIGIGDVYFRWNAHHWRIFLRSESRSRSDQCTALQEACLDWWCRSFLLGWLSLDSAIEICATFYPVITHVLLLVWIAITRDDSTALNLWLRVLDLRRGLQLGKYGWIAIRRQVLSCSQILVLTNLTALAEDFFDIYDGFDQCFVADHSLFPKDWNCRGLSIFFLCGPGPPGCFQFELLARSRLLARCIGHQYLISPTLTRDGRRAAPNCPILQQM